MPRNDPLYHACLISCHARRRTIQIAGSLASVYIYMYMFVRAGTLLLPSRTHEITNRVCRVMSRIRHAHICELKLDQCLIPKIVQSSMTHMPSHVQQHIKQHLRAVSWN